MATRRAPYLYQIEPFVQEAKLRFTRDRFALETREPIQVTVTWQYRGKTLEQEWKAEPGQVLHPFWRDATAWERELFEQKRGEWEALHIAEVNGRMRVQIVELFDDLRAAVRQTLRHIPSRLIGRKVRVKGEEIRVAGEVQEIGTLVESLSRLTQRFAKRTKISPQFTETALSEIASARLALVRARAPLKVRAREELERAAGVPVSEVPIVAAKASVALLERRAQDLQIAESVLKKADRWLRKMRKIERGLNIAYKSLGKWIRKLEPFVLKGEVPEPATLLGMAREAGNLLVFLQRVGAFNPYYCWVHSSPVERLGKALTYAEAGKAKTFLNVLKGALTRIEKGVIGEKPEPGELAKIRRRI